MEKVQEASLTEMLRVSPPGPANGFSLDLILNFERFGPLLDWAMIILSPMEPWPGSICLPAAEQHDVKLITRVVDHGGIFHDDVKPGTNSASAITAPSVLPAGWKLGNKKAQCHAATSPRSTASPRSNSRCLVESRRKPGEERDSQP
ncbi:MAG: hypothetical protein QM765_10870 [Myxococcales bacterium]